MKMIKKVFPILYILFCGHLYAMGVAIVDLKEDKIFQIKSKNNNIGNFRVLLNNDNKVIRDGDFILFTIQLKNITINNTNLSESSELRCYCNETFEQNVKLTKESSNDYASENIQIRLGKNDFSQKKNRPFNISLRFLIPDCDELSFDNVELTITPEISISVDRPIVDFGSLIYDHNIVSGSEQSVSIEYHILNTGRCQIFSQNGFCIKHQDNGYPIKYNIINESLIEVNDKEKIITLNEDNLVCTMRLCVNYYCHQTPPAGNYEDFITLTIIPNE